LFEIILDFLNGQADYSMLVSVFIGLSISFIWIFKIEFTLVQNIHSPQDFKIVKNTPIVLKVMIHIDKRLIWIVKIIRRKENPGDEPDHLFPTPII
jgi:hypothetical protein